MSGGGVCGYHCVELQQTETAFSGGLQTVANKGFSHPSASGLRCHRIAGVGDVTAAADVVWMQDVHAKHSAVLFRDTAGCLFGKEGFGFGEGQRFCLGKGNPVFHDLVPDGGHGGNVGVGIGTGDQ